MCVCVRVCVCHRASMNSKRFFRQWCPLPLPTLIMIRRPACTIHIPHTNQAMQAGMHIACVGPASLLSDFVHGCLIFDEGDNIRYLDLPPKFSTPHKLACTTASLCCFCFSNRIYHIPPFFAHTLDYTLNVPP